MKLGNVKKVCCFKSFKTQDVTLHDEKNCPYSQINMSTFNPMPIQNLK